MWLAEAASRLEKGSSRRRSSGSVWRTRASEVRWRMPWEYWPTGRVRWGRGRRRGGPSRAADAGAAAVAVEPGEVGEVFHGGELVVEHGGVAHVGDAAALLVGSSEKTVTVPRVGLMRPARTRRRVDLPAPFSPRMTVQSRWGRLSRHCGERRSCRRSWRRSR